MFKKIVQHIIFIILISNCINVFAQVGTSCGTPTPSFRPLPVPENYQRTQNTDGMRMIRLFIYVTKGEYTVAQPAQEESQILANFEYMRQYFAPHGICFIIKGFEEIVSDDLNSVDDNSNADFGALQGIANINPDCLTIFIHGNIAGNVIGTAWNIPNKFVSLEGSYTWSGYPQLAGHEVGHALGLYHTFEDVFGIERVNRSGACSNCNTAGDLLCDTEADKRTANFSNTCVYTGAALDSCNNPYLMAGSNPMSYHHFVNCPNPYNFTTGQANRMHYTLDNLPSYQNTLLTNSSLTISTNQNYTTVSRHFVARNNITVNAPSYMVSGTARLQLSSEEINILPGATFSTSGGNGMVVLRANALCQ